MRYYQFLFICLILCLLSCDKYEEKPIPIINNYLHISHTRSIETKYLDSIVQLADYSNYDMIWLGGDMTHLTSENDTFMLHVDSVFDVGNNNTLWSLGNHDHTNLSNIEKYTHRPTYYTTHKNGITIIVLDTQENFCVIKDSQKEFLDSVLDTIDKSSHLVILHHKLIWLVDGSSLEKEIENISNGELGDCHYCLNPNNFHEDIYPKLVEIQNNNIDVICIGGDIGSKVKEYEHITTEGIQFLASGIYSGHSDNKVLNFYHDTENRELTWEYILLQDLIDP